MIAQQQEKSSMKEIFGEVISSYSRDQAIEDGILADLTTLFPRDTRLYKYPVACTSAVWETISNACKHGGDPGAWVWDLCYMSIHYKCKILSPSEHLFKCIIGRKTKIFKINVGPGDNAEPVITIMYPDED